MKKDLLERFIAKYRLDGLVNSAVWVVNKGTLQVKAIGLDGKLFAGVTCKSFDGFEDAEIGVLDTKKLLALLHAIQSEHISLEISRYSSGDVAFLTLAGATMRAEYVASDPKAIDT